MNIAQFGKPQNPDPYEIPQPGADKKRANLLMFGGLALVLLLLGLVLFSGGETAGRQDMLDATESIGESVGTIQSYEGDIKTIPVQNDIALIKVILRGGYQNLGGVYKDVYDEKKSFTNSPKPSESATTTLEAAVKNDTVDSEIVDVLEPQLLNAQRSLIKAKASISGETSRAKILTVQNDLASVIEILEKN